MLVVAIMLKYLLSLFVRLFQQCHLFRIDEVLKFDDSMTDFLEDVPNSYELYVLMAFGLCDGSSTFRKPFSVSCEVFALHG